MVTRKATSPLSWPPLNTKTAERKVKAPKNTKSRKIIIIKCEKYN